MSQTRSLPVPGAHTHKNLLPLVIALLLLQLACSLLVPDPVLPQPTRTSGPPTPTTRLSLTALKYRVLAQFPDLFFCDPDFYPVARADEKDLAQQRFPDVQANLEEFQAILKQNGLAGLTSFSADQKLLIYREHKKLAAIRFEPSGEKHQFQIQVGGGNKQGFSVKGLIDAGGVITVQQRDPAITTCPICLAAGTRIDTPGGPIRVEDLQPGDLVWTMNTAGERVAVIILQTRRAPAPPAHLLIHLALDDGRELRASAGHPTADGRLLGELQSGDRLDGGRVLHIEHIQYDSPATYDLLPDGSTGTYWANGILLGSTLAGNK